MPVTTIFSNGRPGTFPQLRRTSVGAKFNIHVETDECIKLGDTLIFYPDRLVNTMKTACAGIHCNVKRRMNYFNDVDSQAIMRFIACKESDDVGILTGPDTYIHPNSGRSYIQVKISANKIKIGPFEFNTTQRKQLLTGAAIFRLSVYLNHNDVEIPLEYEGQPFYLVNRGSNEECELKLTDYLNKIGITTTAPETICNELNQLYLTPVMTIFSSTGNLKRRRQSDQDEDVKAPPSKIFNVGF